MLKSVAVAILALVLAGAQSTHAQCIANWPESSLAAPCSQGGNASQSPGCSLYRLCTSSGMRPFAQICNITRIFSSLCLDVPSALPDCAIAQGIVTAAGGNFGSCLQAAAFPIWSTSGVISDIVTMCREMGGADSNYGGMQGCGLCTATTQCPDPLNALGLACVSMNMQQCDNRWSPFCQVDAVVAGAPRGGLGLAAQSICLRPGQFTPPPPAPPLANGDPCLADPTAPSCTSYTYPGSAATADITALCGFSTQQPACAVQSACQAGNLTGPACEPFAVLATLCSNSTNGSPSAIACRAYSQLCHTAGTQVHQCSMLPALTLPLSPPVSASPPLSSSPPAMSSPSSSPPAMSSPPMSDSNSTLPSASSSLMMFSDLPAVPTGTGMAHVLRSFSYQTAPGVGLFEINTFLRPEAAKDVPQGAACANRSSDDPCWELLSLWSSAAVMPPRLAKEQFGGSGHLLGLTDRGINGNCADGLKVYVPTFAPTIMDISFDMMTNTSIINHVCTLKDSLLDPITGLPNSAYDQDVPFDGQCDALAYDARGLDTEAIVPIPGTKYCLLAEEYGPSVVVVDCQFKKCTCGQVLMRYVPKGSDVRGLVGGKYKVKANLPAAFLQKRPNKGFESIAVSPSGRTAFVHMQSPLGLYDWAPESSNPNVTVTASSHAMLAIELDIRRPLNAKVKGVYVYIGDRMDNTSSSMWLKSTKAVDLKISETYWASMEAGLTGKASENPVMIVDERAKSEVKLYLADYTNATNVLPMLSAPGANPLMFDDIWGNGYEAGMAAITALGVTPAKKALLLDTATTVDNFTGTDKEEAAVPINKCVIGLGEDNDFGIGAGPSTIHFIQLPACIDAVYTAMLA